MLYHPAVNGRAQSYPVPWHKDSSEIHRSHISKIIRRFNLPKDIFD